MADQTGRCPPTTPTPRGGLVARPVLYHAKTKAYRHAYMEYSDWPQVVDTAKLGGKLPTSRAAETFPDLFDRFQNYDY